jgi:hypothetical protein
MKFIFVSLLFCFATVGAGSSTRSQGRVDYCRMYGAVYIERDRAYADFSVFVAEDDGSANMTVFVEDNALYADGSGIWYFTKDRNQARYRIYLEKTKSFADFSIAYTTARSFAGCR